MWKYLILIIPSALFASFAITPNSAGRTFTGTTRFGTYIASPQIYNAGNSGTSKNLNWSNGTIQRVTLTGNVTFTLSSPVTGACYEVRVKQSTGGSNTVAWPATVRFPGGVNPTQTVTASRVDRYSLCWTGSVYFATFAQNYNES